MITTLLFDLGGTLHSVSRSEETRLRFAERVLRMLREQGTELGVSPRELSELLQKNGEIYKHESEETLRELPSVRIWNEYYLREFGVGEEKLTPIAEELSYWYDCERVVNTPLPRMKETIETLHGMGLRLGMISNIISTTLVPKVLQEYGVAQYMECVVMSSGTGIRKPDPAIFRIAMEELGVTPEETGYVGDTISRDVIGSRRAGLALSVRIENPSIAHRDAAFIGRPDAPEADFVIRGLDELPAIIRKVNGLQPEA